MKKGNKGGMKLGAGGGGGSRGQEGDESWKARLEMYSTSFSNKLKLSQADLDGRSGGPPSGLRSWRDL